MFQRASGRLGSMSEEGLIQLIRKLKTIPTRYTRIQTLNWEMRHMTPQQKQQAKHKIKEIWPNVD